MATPQSLFVWDLEAPAEDRVTGRVHRFMPEEGATQPLEFRWNMAGKKAGFRSLAGGTVKVKVPTQGYKEESYEAVPSRAREFWEWQQSLPGGNWSVVLALPPGYVLGTASDVQPLPKTCSQAPGGDRMAVIWTEMSRVWEVRWRMQPKPVAAGTLADHVGKLNEGIRRRAEKEGAAGEGGASTRPLFWVSVGTLAAFVILFVGAFLYLFSGKGLYTENHLFVTIFVFSAILAIIVFALSTFAKVTAKGQLPHGIQFQAFGPPAAFVVFFGLLWFSAPKPAFRVVQVYLNPVTATGAPADPLPKSLFEIHYRRPTGQGVVSGQDGYAVIQDLPRDAQDVQINRLEFSGYTTLKKRKGDKLPWTYSIGPDGNVSIDVVKADGGHQADWEPILPANIPRYLTPLANEIRGEVDFLSADFKKDLTARRRKNHYLEGENEDARFVYVSRPFAKGEAPEAIHLLAGVDAQLAVLVMEEEKMVLRKLRPIEPRGDTVLCDYKDAATENIVLVAFVYPVSEAAYRLIENQPQFERIAEIHSKGR